MASIQVSVDEALRESAERRAAELDVDLSAYVKDLIRRDVARPTLQVKQARRR